MKPISRHSIAATALICILFSGCGTISTEYGKTKGLSGRSSLNGFGALRTSYERAGFRSRDVTRLSDRVLRTDVIVWTPQVLGAVNPQVTRWLEKWLSRGNHTLVYIVPDSGSEADYWLDAAKLAPPAQRLEYRKRAAKSINERMTWRMNRARVQSNGWFRIEPLVHRTKIGDLSGAWSVDIGKMPSGEADVAVEYLVVAYDPEAEKASAQANAAATLPSVGPTGPGTPNWTLPTETQPTRTPIRFSELVRTETGNPIVAEIDSKNWNNSRIIVVAGGSLLTNYALTRPMNRRLAEKIIGESRPAGVQNPSAGFLTSNWNEIPVTESRAGVPQASGMELLTVWPISLVTMHGVMLGLVIGLMLLPIFGRPRSIGRSKQSDFGHHLDAVAALMNKSGGEVYARARISEYMKRMHGETSGPWVLPDSPAHRVSATLPPLMSKRLASKGRASKQLEAIANARTANPVPTVEVKSVEKAETDPSKHDEAER